MKCITYTNNAHRDLCENMLKSFRAVNKSTPFLVYCMDEESYNWFDGKGYDARNATYVECGSDHHDWGNQQFRQLIQNKFPIIKKELDDQVLFVDSDIYFFKDPIPYLEYLLTTTDVVSQSDLPGTELCSGFFAINPSEQVHNVIDHINDYDAERDGEFYDDQLRWIHFLKETRTPVNVLDRHRFPNGHIAFIENSSHKDKNTQIKIQKVLDKISNYNKKKLDKDSLYEIFKIQMLVSEISK